MVPVPLRFDLVFSYWIYIWYIIYAFKITKYNPKFALIIGLLHNFIMLILMILYGTSKRTIFYFIIVNTIIKILPLYYLQDVPIKIKDVYFTFGLFILFIIWLHMNKQNLVGNIKIIHDSLLYGKDNTPFMSVLNQFKKNYKNLEII